MENVKQMCVFVENYIYNRKGVKVRINPRPIDMYNLVMAYNYAKDFIEKENI